MSCKQPKTTVALTRETVEQLRYVGRKGQTYDDIVQQLLENQRARRHEGDQTRCV